MSGSSVLASDPARAFRYPPAALAASCALVVLLSGVPSTAGPVLCGGPGSGDSDGDCIPDVVDNCTLLPNAAPLDCDTDNDGYGNACDGDFSAFFLSQFSQGSPGPSGLSCAGIVPCP